MQRPGVAPSGTVTLLFTDIEGSTGLWEAHPAEMAVALARHDQLLRGAIEAGGGFVFKTVGDAFCAAFTDATAALGTAVEVQRAFRAEAWPEVIPIRVRMGLHAGICEERDGDYFGPPVNRVARLEAIAHGGQIILSAAAAELVRDRLPGEVSLLDLGEHRLKDLERPERVYQICPDGLPNDFPPLRSVDTTGTLRRVSLSKFVGRARELGEVTEHLVDPDARLVTLTGTGGVGKTRLAEAVAETMGASNAFADGVRRVELAPVAADQVVNAVGSALGVREGPGLTLAESIGKYLSQRRLLLVLDNCEHVIGAAAALLTDVLGAAPALVVLATSQTMLNIAGEFIYPVSTLTLPPSAASNVETVGDCDAVQLFVDRARRANGSFELNAQNASAVAEICRRLDGIPLAIELAAARIRALSVKQILKRLDDRFGLLTHGGRGAETRHQTLRAAVEWSYSLLSDPERRVLSRVSVFPGGFDLEGAETVAVDNHIGGAEVPDVFELVASLIDKSLIATTDTIDGELRYRLLETVRTYAQELLHQRGGSDQADSRLVQWAVTLAEAYEAVVNASGEDAIFRRIMAERENLLAALTHAWTIGDTSAAVRLTSVLAIVFDQIGHYGEGLALCEQALSAPDIDPDLRWRLLLRTGNLSLSSGQLEQARRLFQAALPVAQQIGDDMGVVTALHLLAMTAMWQGDFAEAGSMLDTLQPLLGAVQGASPNYLAMLTQLTAELALYRGDPDPARALGHVGSSDLNDPTLWDREVLLGTVAYATNNLDQAVEHYTAGLDVAVRCEAAEFIALARHGLGVTALASGDLRTARDHLETGLDVARHTGHSRVIAMLLHGLGLLERTEGRREKAQTRQDESLDLRLSMGDKHGIAQNLEACAGLALASGQTAHAAQLYSVASALRQQTTGSRWPVELRTYDADIQALRESLGTGFKSAWSQGATIVADGPDDLAATVAAVRNPETQPLSPSANP